ncbi:MAG TPA: AI-2E family transporter [Blastocatellia bacterium]|nr:AI-2E family transporter [Blastocatellia bacterium]
MAGVGLKPKENQPNHAETVRLWTSVVIRVLLLLACFAALVWLLNTIGKILLLLIISVFFSYLIAPLVRAFEQPVYALGRELRLPRWAAISAVYLILGAALSLVMLWVWPYLWGQISQLTNNLPAYVTAGLASLRQTFVDPDSWFNRLGLPQEAKDYILTHTSQATEAIFSWAQTFVLDSLFYLQYLPWLIIVPLISFFLLRDAAAFEQSFLNAIPNPTLRRRAQWLLRDVSRTLAAYIQAQITACFEIAVLVTAGLGLIDMPYAIVLGVIAGVLEFIPLVGPAVSAVMICGLALTVSWKMALASAIFLIVLRIVQDYVIYPRIVGHGIRMHPLVVVLAILAGAEVGGLSGIFLAIPVVGLVIVGYHHYLAYKGLQSLQDESPTDAAEPQSELPLSSVEEPVPAFKE